jgi:hypothetical protein
MHARGCGLLEGPANVTIKQLTLSGGTMRGSGVTVIPSDGLLDGNWRTFDGRTLRNDGTARCQNLNRANGAVVPNHGTCKLRDSWEVSSLTFRNYARLLKTGGRGPATFRPAPCCNSGTVEAQNGTRLLNSGGGRATGVFTVAAGAILDFAGGSYTLERGLRLDSAGTVRVSPEADAGAPRVADPADSSVWQG